MIKLKKRSDDRIELTRLLKEKTNYFCDTTPIAFVAWRNRGQVVSIFRDIADTGDSDTTGEINANVDARVFMTPSPKQWRASYPVVVTDKYIHIG